MVALDLQLFVEEMVGQPVLCPQDPDTEDKVKKTTQGYAQCVVVYIKVWKVCCSGESLA